ncbi:hypothetical protein RJ641_027936 [Dillenia turbinata]|uniref:Uncharacterized protein n=1 Tax=Dillenia turbinata TaxID=194707 RepID=A0AAN8W3D5_9MAGN
MAFGVQNQVHIADGGALAPITDLEYVNLITPKRHFEGTDMSRRTQKNPKLDLKLNLSPPRVDPRVISPSRAATVSPTSPTSSCVSSELSQEEALTYSNSPEATSMLLLAAAAAAAAYCVGFVFCFLCLVQDTVNEL